jgi:hypothetical protein
MRPQYRYLNSGHNTVTSSEEDFKPVMRFQFSARRKIWHLYRLAESSAGLFSFQEVKGWIRDGFFEIIFPSQLLHRW